MAYTTIDDPTIHFTTLLRNSIYGGSDTSYDIGFQPDWIWDKVRSTTGVHAIFDSVRGVGSSGKVIYTNNSNAEGTNALIKSIDSSGFTVTANSDHSSQTIVDWCWKAGGSASSNSDGTITSSVSASTTAGFSIVSYTSNGSASQTVGHGLASVPQVIISKNRTNGTSTYGNWIVYHHSLATANDKKILLNSTSASSTTNEWGDTDPTSSVYSVHTGGDGATNHSTDQIVSYCFAEKKGYSKFGIYEGASSADGSYIHLGFKPAWFLAKAIGRSENWYLFDNKRLGYNVDNNQLYPDTSGAEGTTDWIDFLSNGVKYRYNSIGLNGSGEQYIYMAFAESPFVNSKGVPNNAR